MNKYQEMLNHFSIGNSYYHIKKYDLDIYYEGYMGRDRFYAHLFYFEKDRHIVKFSIACPTKCAKDIPLVYFTQMFANALNKLLDGIKFEISKYMEGELE